MEMILMDNDNTLLYRRIENLLKSNSGRFLSKQEIMNILAVEHKKNDPIFDEIKTETVLADIEVASSLKNRRSCVYATCRGGTVYYKWIGL